MKIQKNDFVTIEYTGILKESGKIFDTTNELVAKKENIYNNKMGYGPITICIGQNQILKSIDESIIGKDEKAEFTIELDAEKGFGKKNAKLIKLIPSKVFLTQNIKPFVGLEVQIDGVNGIVRSISGGRMLVDFNHPLAGKEIRYALKIIKKITDPKEKIESYLQVTFGIKKHLVTIKDDKAEIEMQLPLQISKTLADKIREIVPEIRNVEFLSRQVAKKA